MNLTKDQRTVLADTLGTGIDGRFLPTRNMMSLYILTILRSVVEEMISDGLMEKKGDYEYVATDAGKAALMPSKE